MVRLAACISLSRAANLAVWAAIVLAVAVPLALVGDILFSSLAAPYFVHYASVLGLRSDATCRLSWKEPFEYEARVYASTQRNVLNGSADFFDTAQLLWHVKPVSIGERYPLHRTTAKVTLPREFMASHNSSLGMYAHLFVQRAGQFSPHPNTSDPLLAYSWAQLAAQSLLIPIDSTQSGIPEGFVLNAYPKVAWAISLEDYAYRTGHLPSHVVGASQSNSDGPQCVYNPPIFQNSFTDTWPDPSILAFRHMHKSRATARAKEVSVVLELRGIRTGWISVKTGLATYASPQLNGTANDTAATPATDSWSVQAAVAARFSRIQGRLFKEYIMPRSVPSLLAAIGSLLLALLSFLVYAKTATSFWLGPKAAWAGVSRAYVAAELASALIYAVHSPAWSRNTIYLWCLARYAVFAPLMAAELVAALRKRRSCAVQPEAAAGTREPAGPIDAARAKVDRAAWWWWTRVVAPLVLAVFVAVAPFLLRVKLLSSESAWSLAAFYMRVLYALHIVPQVVLNARARSGALVPPIVLLSYTSLRVFYALSLYASGEYSVSHPLIEEGVGHAGTAIFVTQWIWYRKPKQD